MGSYMERVLGIKFDRKPWLPRSSEQGEVFVLYFSVSAPKSAEEAFGHLIEKPVPPLVKDGGVVLAGCEINTPTGMHLHAVACRGDLEGWKLHIERGIQMLGLTHAYVLGDRVILSNGDEQPLSACTIRFY